MAIKKYEKNGVTFFHKGKGKWEFTGTGKNGVPFTKLDVVNGVENAERVVAQIAGSLKRSDGIDGLARTHIGRVLDAAIPHYRGINFSRAGNVFN